MLQSTDGHNNWIEQKLRRSTNPSQTAGGSAAGPRARRGHWARQRGHVHTWNRWQRSAGGGGGVRRACPRARSRALSIGRPSPSGRRVELTDASNSDTRQAIAADLRRPPTAWLATTLTRGVTETITIRAMMRARQAIAADQRRPPIARPAKTLTTGDREDWRPDQALRTDAALPPLLLGAQRALAPHGRHRRALLPQPPALHGVARVLGDHAAGVLARRMSQPQAVQAGPAPLAGRRLLARPLLQQGALLGRGGRAGGDHASGQGQGQGG